MVSSRCFRSTVPVASVGIPIDSIERYSAISEIVAIRNCTVACCSQTCPVSVVKRTIPEISCVSDGFAVDVFKTNSRYHTSDATPSLPVVERQVFAFIVSLFQSAGKRTAVRVDGRQSSKSKVVGTFPFVTRTVAVISLSCKTSAFWTFSKVFLEPD